MDHHQRLPGRGPLTQLYLGGPIEIPTRFPNVFTVDVEDWYQGIEIDMKDWDRFSPRIEIGLQILLDLLEGSGTRATFFVLGFQAERTPRLIRTIAERGHEVASHGYLHRFVYQQSPDEFRTELRRSKALLEDITGTAVLGFRAPYFSITAQSLWALDILAEEGFAYDSSVFPVMNYRYGILGASRHPGWLRTENGNRIYEVPLSTVRLPYPTSPIGLNVPLSGGGYFRLYPYVVTRALSKLLQREGQGLVFYVHPWEYDALQPRIRMPRLVPELTHYYNLESMVEKTRRLLRDFRFGTMRAAFGDDLGYGGKGGDGAS